MFAKKNELFQNRESFVKSYVYVYVLWLRKVVLKLPSEKRSHVPSVDVSVRTLRISAPQTRRPNVTSRTGLHVMRHVTGLCHGACVTPCVPSQDNGLQPANGKP